MTISNLVQPQAERSRTVRCCWKIPACTPLMDEYTCRRVGTVTGEPLDRVAHPEKREIQWLCIHEILMLFPKRLLELPELPSPRAILS